jgi:hypothetical protein
MSSNGKGRGRKPKATNVVESPLQEAQSFDQQPMQSAPTTTQQESSQDRQRRRAPAKTIDDYKRALDIIGSRVDYMIDTLDGDDAEPVTKKTVVTTVKHLKQIHTMIEQLTN